MFFILIMEKRDIAFLVQLVKTLEEAESQLETSYSQKNHEKFNKIKKLMLSINEKMSGVLK